MDQPENKRQFATVAVSMPVFQQWLNRIMNEQGGDDAGVLSRLALVHRAAKEVAVEAVGKKDVTAVSIDVEELTNPPLFDFYPEEEPVLIHYSYMVS